jgi:hypothetical protein
VAQGRTRLVEESPQCCRSGSLASQRRRVVPSELWNKGDNKIGENLSPFVIQPPCLDVLSTVHSSNHNLTHLASHPLTSRTPGLGRNFVSNLGAVYIEARLWTQSKLVQFGPIEWLEFSKLDPRALQYMAFTLVMGGRFGLGLDS